MKPARTTKHAKASGEEEQFRLLVESVVDYAIFMLDPEGIVRTWNPGAERIKGYRAEEIIGQHFACFYTPEDVSAGVPQDALARSGRSGRYEAEGWRVRKNGERFWAKTVLTALYGEGQRLRGFCKVTQDLTERMRLEQELRVKNAELERALRTTFSPQPGQSHTS
jgi:PAS domain S-box-containing protein